MSAVNAADDTATPIDTPTQPRPTAHGPDAKPERTRHAAVNQMPPSAHGRRLCLPAAARSESAPAAGPAMTPARPPMPRTTPDETTPRIQSSSGVSSCSGSSSCTGVSCTVQIASQARVKIDIHLAPTLVVAVTGTLQSTPRGRWKGDGCLRTAGTTGDQGSCRSLTSMSDRPDSAPDAAVCATESLGSARAGAAPCDRFAGTGRLLVELFLGLRVGSSLTIAEQQPSSAAGISESLLYRKRPHVANIKSQIKRNKTNIKANERNKAVKSELKTLIRSTRTAVTAGDKAAAEASLKKAAVKLDKAVSKGVLHKNQASNRKSALAKHVASL